MPNKTHRLHPVVSAVRRTYRRLGASDKGLLLAVSGGLDSTALLLATVQLASSERLRLEIACLDHGLREEGAGEVRRVQAACARLSLPFHSRKLGLAPGPQLEARARSARYAALDELRQEAGLDFVVTAHTASDQAETLLMRLARGSSLRGAAGVRPRMGKVLRPLLGITRGELEGFVSSLRTQGHLPYAPIVDPMNSDPRFLRTRIRLDAVPALERALGHPVAVHLARFACLADEDASLLDELADQAEARLSLPEGGLDRVGLRALPLPLRRRLLARLVASADGSVDFDLVDGLVEALDSGCTFPLPKDQVFEVGSGRVRCLPAPPRKVRGTRATGSL